MLLLLSGDDAGEFAGVDGPVDLCVHVVTDPDDLVERPLAETARDEWDRRCDGVIRQAVDFAQEAHRTLAAAGGGRIVFVVPTIGMTGAAGLVPFATACEGIRSLAKSAARQWGADGITVATVARHVAGPTVALASLPAPTTEDAVGVVRLLAQPDAGALTGTTLVVDGGTVLVP
jgi:3-oxoacyl-[acyl-carrier protein] reductase